MILTAIQAREELMAATSHIYAGAARSMDGTFGGVFRQAVGDDRWEHLTSGRPHETDVHPIKVPPDNGDVIYLGTTKGAYRRTNRGASWEPLRLPDPEAAILWI